MEKLYPSALSVGRAFAAVCKDPEITAKEVYFSATVVVVYRIPLEAKVLLLVLSGSAIPTRDPSVDHTAFPHHSAACLIARVRLTPRYFEGVVSPLLDPACNFSVYDRCHPRADFTTDWICLPARTAPCTDLLRHVFHTYRSSPTDFVLLRTAQWKEFDIFYCNGRNIDLSLQPS